MNFWLNVFELNVDSQVRFVLLLREVIGMLNKIADETVTYMLPCIKVNIYNIFLSV